MIPNDFVKIVKMMGSPPGDSVRNPTVFYHKLPGENKSTVASS